MENIKNDLNDCEKVKCYNCIYFNKKLSAYNHLNYICKRWGIVSYKFYPSNIIKKSIGKECPFFQERTNNKNGANDNKDSENNLIDIKI